MSAIRIEREGLMLDEVIASTTGADGADRVEAALNANAGLAARLAQQSHQLAPGSSFDLADAPKRSRRIIQLWD